MKSDGSIPLPGVLNMNSQKITALQNPEKESDAANKKYCDDKINEEIKTFKGKIPKFVDRKINETIGPNVLKALNYMDIMKTLKPVLWLSGFNANFSSINY